MPPVAISNVLLPSTAHRRVMPAGGGTFLTRRRKYPKTRLKGERWERCRWQMKRPERVAAVGERRSRSVGKESTGHRNRTAGASPCPTLPPASEANPLRIPLLYLSFLRFYTLCFSGALLLTTAFAMSSRESLGFIAALNRNLPEIANL